MPRKGHSGRKPYQPTPSERQKVEELMAAGVTLTGTAATIGIDVATLNLRFAEEIEKGAAKKKAEAIHLLWKSARKGNVSAQKALIALHIGTPARNKATGDQPVRSTKLGKKEIAQRDAETAGEGTDWGDDLQPPPESVN